MINKLSEINVPLVVNYQQGYEYQIEECHGIHNLSGNTYEVYRVRVCINDEMIDITGMLTESMIDYIVEELNDIIE